jgi:hypothetical protein
MKGVPRLCCCCSRKDATAKKGNEMTDLYDVFQLAKLTFFMKGKDRLKYSVVLLLKDAITARNLFYTLESKREVVKRDIRNEKALVIIISYHVYMINMIFKYI